MVGAPGVRQFNYNKLFAAGATIHYLNVSRTFRGDCRTFQVLFGVSGVNAWTLWLTLKK